MSSTSEANIRSLLRKELSSRRITHPYASYTNKSNLLSCTVCHLVIKSEGLWDGHLRSSNHRKNVQKLQERQQQQQQHQGDGTGDIGLKRAGRKRKADEVDVDNGIEDRAEAESGGGAVAVSMNGGGGRKRKAADDTDDDESGEDGRKKTKKQSSPSQQMMDGFIPASTPADQNVDQPAAEQSTTDLQAATAPDATAPPVTSETEPPPPALTVLTPTINEDEWAAFEADIAPLTQNPQPSNTSTTTTITAAPVSAVELAAQKEAAEKKGRVLSREEEAEAEREDEGRRMAEEFELQEEMEERVKKLRERREMLRLQMREGHKGNEVSNADVVGHEKEVAGGQALQQNEEGDEEEEDDDDELDRLDGWGI